MSVDDVLPAISNLWLQLFTFVMAMIVWQLGPIECLRRVLGAVHALMSNDVSFSTVTSPEQRPPLVVPAHPSMPASSSSGSARRFNDPQGVRRVRTVGVQSQVHYTRDSTNPRFFPFHKRAGEVEVGAPLPTEGTGL